MLSEQQSNDEPAAARPTVGAVGPARALRRLRAQVRKGMLRFRLGAKWERTADGFSRRVYPDYGVYLEHQRTKFDAARASFVRGHDVRFHAALSERLAQLPLDLHGRSVLCIAARQGTEVRAFIDAGAFAVGIDLNPGRENRYVVVGDFHALQYATGTVDIVYTNSLDHAFDLDRVLAEIHRVLTADGALVAELNGGDEGASDAGFYESTGWPSVDRVIARIEATGFVVRQRTAFDVPWPGEQVVLSKSPAPAQVS
jgi:SAM-dependent methyltransferase